MQAQVDCRHGEAGARAAAGALFVRRLSIETKNVERDDREAPRHRNERALNDDPPSITLWGEE